MWNDTSKGPHRLTNILVSTCAVLVIALVIIALDDEDNDLDEAKTSHTSERETLVEKLDQIDDRDSKQGLDLLVAIAATDSSTEDDIDEALTVGRTVVEEQSWRDLNEKMEVLRNIESVASNDWLTNEIDETEFYLLVESDCRASTRRDLKNALQIPSSYNYNFGRRFWDSGIYVQKTEFTGENAFGVTMEFVAEHHCTANPETERYSNRRVLIEQRPHPYLCRFCD